MFWQVHVVSRNLKDISSVENMYCWVNCVVCCLVSHAWLISNCIYFHNSESECASEVCLSKCYAFSCVSEVLVATFIVWQEQYSCVHSNFTRIWSHIHTEFSPIIHRLARGLEKNILMSLVSHGTKNVRCITCPCVYHVFRPLHSYPLYVN